MEKTEGQLIVEILAVMEALRAGREDIERGELKLFEIERTVVCNRNTGEQERRVFVYAKATMSSEGRFCGESQTGVRAALEGCLDKLRKHAREKRDEMHARADKLAGIV